MDALEGSNGAVTTTLHGTSKSPAAWMDGLMDECMDGLEG